MTPDLVVLLPPSEGKAGGGTGRWAPTSGRFGRRLAGPRQTVIEALARTGPLTEKQLGVRGELLDRAQAATQAIVDGRAKRLPAWQRYTGVVWQHLDPHTLDDEQRARILVPSALLGLVGGNDPVPDHRLKFDVRLGPEVDRRLDRYWRPILTEALRHATTPRTTIVDLLPIEHRNAIDLDGDRVLRKRVHRPDDVPNIGGHDGKAEKGRLARRLLTGSD